MQILGSEFVWGIVIGIVLAWVGAAVSIHLDSRRRRRAGAEFFQDLLGSVCDQIQNLEDNRDRSRVIFHEFLAMIEVEVSVYARNREQLVLLRDLKIREDVRKFFTQAAAILTDIKSHLDLHYRANEFAQRQTGPDSDNNAAAVAAMHLGEAHSACERLRQLMGRRKELSDRLDGLSKKVF